MREPTWLDRNINVLSFHYVLCLTAHEFLHLHERLGYEPGRDTLLPWVTQDAIARCTLLHNKYNTKQKVWVVSLNEAKCANGIEIASALAHEAVHLYQYHCDYIGEEHPAKEAQAYGIENIFLTLMNEYVRLKQIA